MTGEAFYESEYYEELMDLTTKLERWYDIKKVTWYVVYVYSKDDPEINLFDIWRDEVVMLDDSHTIPPKANTIIQKIQEKMTEINTYLEEE